MLLLPAHKQVCVWVSAEKLWFVVLHDNMLLMQEVRKVIRESVLPYSPPPSEPAVPTAQAASPSEKPGDASATVDAQGDVCMAPGAEEGSMNGNAANGKVSAPAEAPKEQAPNGHSHDTNGVEPMEQDTPLEGRVKEEGALDALLNKAQNGAETKPSAVKLSVAPPAHPVAPLAETGLKLKKEEVAARARLIEDDFRALQQRAANLQVLHDASTDLHLKHACL